MNEESSNDSNWNFKELTGRFPGIVFSYEVLSKIGKGEGGDV